MADPGLATESVEATAPGEAALPADDGGRLLWLRVGYFAIYSSMVVVNAYGALIYAAKGFAPAAIGLLCGCSPVATLLVTPAVTHYAGGRGLQQRCMTVGVTAAFTALVVLCVTPTGETWGKAVVAGAAVGYYVFMRPVLPLFDDHATTVLGPSRKPSWGRYRLLGSIGWGAAALWVAQAAAMTGWTWAFALWIPGAALFLAAVAATPLHRTPAAHDAKSVAAMMWRRPRVMLFLAAMATMGLGYSLVATFLFLYLQEALGAPHILLGLCLTCTVLIEIPVFRCSVWLHQKFSDRQLLAASMAVWSLRAAGYASLPSPWLVLALEPLHGVTFGCMYLAGVHMVTTVFPPKTTSSGFGIMYAAYFGVGPLIGNVAGGVAFASIGPRMLYAVGSAGMLLASIAFYVTDAHLEAAGHLWSAEEAGEVSQSPDHGRLKEDPRHPDATDLLPE